MPLFLLPLSMPLPGTDLLPSNLSFVGVSWQALKIIDLLPEKLLLLLQLSMPLPGNDLLPGNYPALGSAGGATPRTPITVTMPATRQPDLPSKKHHR